MRQFIVEAPMMLKVAFFGWSKHWSTKSRIFWLKDIAISFRNIFWPNQPTTISLSLYFRPLSLSNTCTHRPVSPHCLLFHPSYILWRSCFSFDFFKWLNNRILFKYAWYILKSVGKEGIRMHMVTFLNEFSAGDPIPVHRPVTSVWSLHRAHNFGSVFSSLSIRMPHL